jgi:hypothetical protein
MSNNINIKLDNNNSNNLNRLEELICNKMKNLSEEIKKIIEFDLSKIPHSIYHLVPPNIPKTNEEKVHKIVELINIYTSSSYSSELLSIISRSYFTKYISWWFPSYDVLEKIHEVIKGKTILELGAGFGLMSALLSLLCSKIIGVDENNIDKSLSFFNVENITIQESLEKYLECEVLLIVWPLFHGFNSTEIFEKFKGNIIILIGEPNSGCTEDIFFPPNWNQIDHDVKVKNWDGIHDKLFIYQKLE